MFAGAYRHKRVFVTGHTGFKGAWLCTWLLQLGARVTGYADRVSGPPDLFTALALEDRITHVTGDVRDRDRLTDALLAADPDFVFHLAAQPLVRRSYCEPVETITTNVTGTLHVLDALRQLERPASCVIVTSDKCYENRDTTAGYREDDPLGGHDPYSASKGAAEIVAHAYRRSYFEGSGSPVRIATARAGNVIGGGDWSEDRIVPDCVRSLIRGEPIAVRSPAATRPWQHVLEPTSGYLWLAAALAGGTRLADGSRESFSQAFNFGPRPDDNRSVGDLVEQFLSHWPGEWKHQAASHPVHEASLLNLAIDRASEVLSWQPTYDFARSVAATARWYRCVAADETTAIAATHDDIADYTAAARSLGLAWTQPIDAQIAAPRAPSAPQVSARR